ncbi:MAG: hypothetical protein HY979_00385 [Candidatus Magasanikbacteria bacterium]|nr:hypothetical protein [Candidatus Magasanikbacteria bacterium]
MFADSEGERSGGEPQRLAAVARKELRLLAAAVILTHKLWMRLRFALLVARAEAGLLGSDLLPTEVARHLVEGFAVELTNTVLGHGITPGKRTTKVLDLNHTT